MIASKPTPEDPGLAFDLEPQRSVGAAGLGVAEIQSNGFISRRACSCLVHGRVLGYAPEDYPGVRDQP